jgi:uncharacterized protein (DUF1697 family)
VIVRTAAQWAKLAQGNPFAEAARDAPNRLMLMVCKSPPADDAAQVIQARARDGEQVRRAGDAIWIHYPGGAGTSRLSPAQIDRAIGAPATARNHNTLLKLKEMLES